MNPALIKSSATIREFVEKNASIEPTEIDGVKYSYKPQDLWHIYLHLEFEPQYENASNLDDAKSFLKKVGEATQVSDFVTSHFNGVVLEAQGSTIHLALPHENEGSKAKVQTCCHILHQQLKRVFSGSKKVKAWRFVADHGKTLVVNGRGIHGDSSSISLGNAANTPAKYLYQQLALNLEEQDLKRFHYGEYCEDSWIHLNLDSPEMLVKAAHILFENQKNIEFDESRFDVSVGSYLIEKSARIADIQAQAAPVDSHGESPQNESPNTYFGWTLRADLDGFTQRVENCFDNDQALEALAHDFIGIMDKAASFAEEHEEVLIQLPWAGDNFTAVAQFDTKDDYEAAKQTRIIDFSLDFEDAMHNVAKDSGFNGWAQGVAGGAVHGNASGNVFLGSVDVKGRRFLLGAGSGIGLSIRAFSDMDPEEQCIAILKEDYNDLVKPYKDCLTNSKKANSEQSTLFRKGLLANLNKAQEKVERLLNFEAESTELTVPRVGRVVAAPRPYSK